MNISDTLIYYISRWLHIAIVIQEGIIIIIIIIIIVLLLLLLLVKEIYFSRKCYVNLIEILKVMLDTKIYVVW